MVFKKKKNYYLSSVHALFLQLFPLFMSVLLSKI